MRFGVHVSIAGKVFLAVDRARKRDCQCMQIFSSNPRKWQTNSLEEEVALKFRKRRQETHISPLAVHAPYLVNLASPSHEIFQKSIAVMNDALEKAKVLEAEYVVFHVGNHSGTGQSAGLLRIAEALSPLLDNSPDGGILLENTSGSGFFLGSKFEELKIIFEHLNWHQRVGVCFDTCHGFAAGYDISTLFGLEQTLASFDKLLGIKRLRLIHANDSRSALGSRLDRHEHIGDGFIGLKGFKEIVNHRYLSGLPCILETPRMSFQDDMRNLSRIRKLTQVENKVEN